MLETIFKNHGKMIIDQTSSMVRIIFYYYISPHNFFINFGGTKVKK
jgi:hypothetical protein